MLCERVAYNQLEQIHLHGENERKSWKFFSFFRHLMWEFRSFLKLKKNFNFLKVLKKLITKITSWIFNLINIQELTALDYCHPINKINCCRCSLQKLFLIKKFSQLFFVTTQISQTPSSCSSNPLRNCWRVKGCWVWEKFLMSL